jgi:hypothetical protein
MINDVSRFFLKSYRDVPSSQDEKRTQWHLCWQLQAMLSVISL